MAVVDIHRKKGSKPVYLPRPSYPPTLSPFNDYAPDQDGLGAWARQMFIEPGGPLFNARYDHLRKASIGWLWSSVEAVTRGLTIAGECSLTAQRAKTFSAQLRGWQLRQWYGDEPDFVITISSDAADFDDAGFCALIEHELGHCGHAHDGYGQPRFDREGKPIYTILPHDVEEFVHVVERYGAATARNVEALVAAANAKPMFGEAALRGACGTCSKSIAA